MLSDIKIKKSFAVTIPKESKMTKCREHWNTYHCQDRTVVVNRNNELVDGYIQYLIFKENNISEIEVKIQEKRKDIITMNNPHYKNHLTTYVYGVHFNKKNCSFSKEYVWRVPDSWRGWENGLLPGDKILVATKHGFAPIIITRIEWLNKCPVNIPVRRVYKKLV